MPEFSYGKDFSRLGSPFVLNDMISPLGAFVEDAADCPAILTHTDESHVARHEHIDLAADTQDKKDISRLRALVSKLCTSRMYICC